MSNVIEKQIKDLLEEESKLKKELWRKKEELKQEERKKRQVELRKEEAEHYYQFVLNSKTWRLTAPFRKVIGGLTRPVKKLLGK